MVRPPGFEPESIEPKSTSLDQASRRPQTIDATLSPRYIHKNLIKLKNKFTLPTNQP